MKELIPYTLQDGLSQSGSYVLMLLEPLSRRQVPIYNRRFGMSPNFY